MAEAQQLTLSADREVRPRLAGPAIFLCAGPLLPLAREAGWIIIAQGLAGLAAVLGVRLLTEALGPGEYGALSVAAVLAVASVGVMLAPIGAASNWLYHEHQARNEAGQLLLVSMVLYAGSSGLTGLVVAALWAAGVARPAFAHSTFVLLCGTLIAAELIKGPVISLANTARQRRVYALLSALDGWCRLLLAILFIRVFGSTFPVAGIGYAAGSFLTALVGWLAILRLHRQTVVGFDWRVLRLLGTRMLAFGWSLPLTTLFTWVITTSDRSLIGVLLSASHAGIYTAGAQVASILPQAASSVLVTFFVPVVMQRHANTAGGGVVLGQAVGYLLLVQAPLVMAGIVVPEGLLSLLAAETYVEARSVVPWLAAGALFFAIDSLAATAFLLDGRTAQLLPVRAAGALANVTVNMVLIPHFGIVGAAIATLVTNGFQCVAVVFYGRKLVKWHVPKLHVVAMAAGSTGAGAVAIYLHDVGTVSRLVVIGGTYALGAAAALYANARLNSRQQHASVT